jgi:putative transposase
LLKILIQELTSKGKDFSPFWSGRSNAPCQPVTAKLSRNNYLTEISKNLSLPTETDLRDLDLSFLNGFSKNMTQKSWQLILPKKQQTNKSLPLQLFSLHDVTDKEEQRYARKIRFYPTKQQKIMLNKQFGLSRYYYNKTIDIINNDYKNKKDIMNHLCKKGCIFQNEINGKTCRHKLENKYFCKKHIKKSFKYKHYKSKIDMRKHILKNEKNDEWKKDIPFDSKTLTINNAIESLKSAISNFTNGNIDGFQMGFRSKKDKSQVFKVDYRAIVLEKRINGSKIKSKNKIKLFVKSIWKDFSELKIKSNKDLNWLVNQFSVGPKYYKNKGKKVQRKSFTPCDFTIKKESPNKYYLCIPSFQKNKDEKTQYEIVSLDPGIRTFQTFYSPEGVIGKIGEGMDDKLLSIGQRLDKMISLKTQKSKKIQRRMNRRCDLLRTKIKNIVKDLHNKTATYLCKTFDKILLPKFGVKNMVIRKTRNIKNMTVRKMLSLSHCKFREIIKERANKYNRKLYICNEAYTSKTCGRCGNIKGNLGGNETYNCSKCHLIIDRDLNGARNVLLRQLSGL